MQKRGRRGTNAAADLALAAAFHPPHTLLTPASYPPCTLFTPSSHPPHTLLTPSSHPPHTLFTPFSHHPHPLLAQGTKAGNVRCRRLGIGGRLPSSVRPHHTLLTPSSHPLYTLLAPSSHPPHTLLTRSSHAPGTGYRGGARTQLQTWHWPPPSRQQPSRPASAPPLAWLLPPALTGGGGADLT